MIGTKLGPYEVVAKLGEGGMGEVYKATDTRLGRDVAIKVLPAHWMDNAEMQARFRQEAQTIASLNHPNICALHDIGFVPTDDTQGKGDGSGSRRQDPSPVCFLVMEFLEGETLAARLARGALGLNDALDIAIPIADALDQSHRRGVVHRDLKPANVMLTPSGPKLLDFGIAKTLAATASGADGLTARALTTPLTMQGMVIGTLQYMAPEQIDGLDADARTDIFAFGMLLHEMVTGKKAFEGKSQALLISSIATSDPAPLSTVQPATPPALEHLVKACLAKDPDDRWQTMRDLVVELRWIAEGGAASAPVALGAAAAATRRWPGRIPLAAAAALAAILAVPASLYTFGPTAAPGETRYRLGGFSPTVFPVIDDAGMFALSPAADRVALVGRDSGPEVLWIGHVGALTVQKLPGTEGARQPFWSADGRSIAFVASGSLKRVDASGGPPQVICAVPSFFGGSWNADGSILFGSATGLQRVSAQGGTPETITSLEDGETGHYWPHFLPDGRRFLYLTWSADQGRRAVFAGRLGEKNTTRVTAAESNVVYTAAGHLVFHRQATLYAQLLDVEALTLTGDPQRVADNLVFSANSGRALFDVARDGTLLYGDSAVVGVRGGFDPSTFEQQLTWIDFTARPETVGPAGVYRGAQISPDGRRIAVHQHDATGGDVWVIEPDGSRRRITFDPARDNSSPIWSPDGKNLVYTARRDGKWGLYRIPSNAAGAAELLYEDESPKAATSWAPDGSSLVFWKRAPETNGDLFVLPLEGDRKPVPVVATPADETHGQISRDGKWLVYASNETKADQTEIYAQPFPSGDGRYQLSTAGGDWPRWSADGKRVFFMAPEATVNASVLSAVTVTASGTALNQSRPEPVVEFMAINSPHEGGDYPTYAVAPDGRRLLISQMVFPLTMQNDTFTADSLTTVYGLAIARHWETALMAGKR